MVSQTTSSVTSFDEYAEAYDDALAQGLMISGEDKSYFAKGRVAWLAECLQDMRFRPGHLVDFGCGTGSAVPFFHEFLAIQSVLGVDSSVSSIAKARRLYGSDQVRFTSIDRWARDESVDLVFCNGVFHHIPPTDRPDAIHNIFACLRPGGLFALWENNPWNPGTWLVMSRIPFDRDAITLSPPEARRLVRTGGFEVLRTDFLFIFPRFMRWFRRLEPRLARLPFGAQYQVLCRKPEKPRISRLRAA